MVASGNYAHAMAQALTATRSAMSSSLVAGPLDDLHFNRISPRCDAAGGDHDRHQIDPADRYQNRNHWDTFQPDSHCGGRGRHG
jgi:hypothetical protein